MAGTAVTYDIIARDRASKAFLGVAESAKAQQAAVTKAFNEQDAVVRRSNSRLLASLKAEETGLASAATAAQKYGKSTAFLNSHKEQLDKVATGLAGVGAAAAIGFGAAVKHAADYNEVMARVGAFSDDARSHMDQLRQLSMKVGTAMGFSATQSAQAMEEMVKAGVSSTNMINGGLKGALALAAAGQIDVAQATEIASAAMTQFGLSGKQIPHVADLLAAGADKALGGVGDLGEAMKYAGTQSKQYGVSIEDTVGVLADFASHGQLGEMAGAQFAQMLSRLGAPTAKAAKEMKALGLNVYDSNGNFVDMTTLAGRLTKAFDKLTPAQRNAAEQTIFGQRAMRAANILVQDGAKGVQNWINKVNDQGFAAQTASRKLDSLKGDLTKLKAAFDNMLIGAGNGSQGPIREAVQTLTKWIDAWDNLGPSAQHAIADVVGAIAVLGLGGAATIKVLTGVAAMKKAFIDLGVTGKATGAEMAAGTEAGAAGLGRMQKAAGGAAAAIIGIQTAGQIANAIIGDYTVSTDQATASLSKLATSSKAASNSLSDVFKETKTSGDLITSTGGGVLGIASAFAHTTTNINGLGDALNRTFNRNGLQTVNDWVTHVGSSVGLAQGQFDQLKTQFSEVDTGLANMAQGGASKQAQAAAAFKKISAAAAENHVSMKQLMTLFPQYKAYLDQQTSSQEASTSATQRGASAQQLAAVKAAQLKEDTDGLTAANKALAKQLQTVIDKFTILNQGALDQEQANEGWKQALADLSKQAVDSAKSSEKVASAERAVTVAEQRLNDLRKSGHSTRAEVLSAENTLANARDRLKTATQGASDAAAANSKSLNINTQAGRDNRAKIVALIQAMNDKVSADFKAKVQTEGVVAATKDATTEMHRLSGNLVENAGKADYNRQKVKGMVDQMVLTPKQLRTQVLTPGITDAQSQIKDLQAKMAALHSKTIRLNYQVGAGGKTFKTLQFQDPQMFHATGGPIAGPGSGTSDDVPIMASNGEYMIRTAAANKLGRGRLDYMNRTGNLPGFASGGIIDRNLIVQTMFPSGAPSALGSLLSSAQSSITKNAEATAKKQISFIPPSGGGSGVARWAPLILKALSLLGQPGSLLGAVEHRMNQESGGNPNAINNWDSNAAAGDPSRGLMQTIGSTFSAYAGPFRNRGIYDPMANIYAGLNYALHAYGSIYAAMMKAGGYANGTMNATPGVHLVGEKGPELVMFGGGEQVIPHMASGGPVKASAFGSSYAFSVAAIVRLIRQIAQPMRDLAHFTSAMKASRAASGAASHVADVAHRRDVSAAHAYSSAVATRNRLREDHASSERLAKANAKVTATSKAKTAAQNAYNKALDKSKTKSDAYKQAQQDLATEQQAVADSAKQVSDSFSGLYTQASTGSIMDLFNSMRKGTTDINAFGADIGQLRKKGLSESIIDQIIAQAQSGGVASGIGLANQAIGGGPYLIGLLNKTAQGLQDAADKFGYSTATAKGTGYAAGTNWATAGIHTVGENGVELVVGKKARRFMGGEMVQPVGYQPDRGFNRTFQGGIESQYPDAKPSELHVHYHGVTSVHESANEIQQLLRKDDRYKGGIKMDLRTRSTSR